MRRLMQRCLGNLVNDSLLIYLDDVVMFSPDFNSNVCHPEVVSWTEAWTEATAPKVPPVPVKGDLLGTGYQ